MILQRSFLSKEKSKNALKGTDKRGLLVPGASVLGKLGVSLHPPLRVKLQALQELWVSQGQRQMKKGDTLSLISPPSK